MTLWCLSTIELGKIMDTNVAMSIYKGLTISGGGHTPMTNTDFFFESCLKLNIVWKTGMKNSVPGLDEITSKAPDGPIQ